MQLDVIEWMAAIGAMAAAVLIDVDWGRHRTGTGFILFAIVSVLWILAGFLQSSMALVAQNGILLAINMYGVWRYLISPRDTGDRSTERSRRASEARSRRGTPGGQAVMRADRMGGL